MKIILGLVRFGNRLLERLALALALLLAVWGGYSLWCEGQVARGAYLNGAVLRCKPTEEDPENPTLADLQAINPDVVGWLTVPDTHIDYPVVQGEDDMEYVNRNVEGEYSLSGAIFLSCLNADDFSDGYNLVYGHHMDSGGMFGDVTRFTEEDYFAAHPSGVLYRPGQTWDIHFFACVQTDAADPVLYTLRRAADRSALVKRVETLAVQQNGGPGEAPVIALSTCTDALTNGRVVLLGWLEARENEKEVL